MKTTTNVLNPNILNDAVTLTEASKSPTITPAPAVRRRPLHWMAFSVWLLFGFVAYQVTASTYRLNHLLDEVKMVFETPIR